MAQTKTSDKIGKVDICGSGVISIISVVAIFGFLIAESIPALNKIGFFNFLFGNKWAPDRRGYLRPVPHRFVRHCLHDSRHIRRYGGSAYYRRHYRLFYGGFPRILLSEKTQTRAYKRNQPAGGHSLHNLRLFRHGVLLPMLAMIAPNDGSGLLATSLGAGHNDNAHRRLVVAHQSRGRSAKLLRRLGGAGLDAQPHGVFGNVSRGEIGNIRVAGIGHRTRAGRNHGGGHGFRATPSRNWTDCFLPSACLPQI